RITKNLISRQRAFLKTIRQRGAFDEFHYQVVNAVLVTDVIEGTDVRMIQARHRSSLTFESLMELGVCREVIWQDFDRHRPIETSVTRAIDFSHPARAERGEDFVRSELCARGYCHTQEIGSLLGRSLSPQIENI